MRLCFALSLAALACRPPTAASPGSASVVASPIAMTPAPAPEPAPAPAPESAPTWEWAVSVLPALAEHGEAEPGAAALARFLGWFGADRSPRVHLLLDDACHAIAGTVDEDGFHGSWRTRVRIEGDERRVSGMNLDITRWGISESGPGGAIYRRDPRGRWMEVGGFGTGSFHTLVDAAMSAADERAVTFAGYSYGLTPVCEAAVATDQTCLGGQPRRCELCTGVWLKPNAAHMAWGHSKTAARRVEPNPVDCSQACPVDPWTDLLPRLATALAGRRFSGVLAGQGPVVFRRAKDCARALRKVEAAAARRRDLADTGRE